jgi:Na+-transporting NADH:ubiquinone oxidoreductase subunit NqrD
MLKFIMIYMYLFSLPKLSVTLFKNLSCRNIGGVSYLLSYLNEHCYNETHQKYGLFVMLPVSLFIFGLIPWSLISRIRGCRMLLDLDKVPIYSKVVQYAILVFGYRKNVYYFEVLRIFLKTAIMVVLVILSDSIISCSIFGTTTLLFSNFIIA